MKHNPPNSYRSRSEHSPIRLPNGNSRNNFTCLLKEKQGLVTQNKEYALESVKFGLCNSIDKSIDKIWRRVHTCEDELPKDPVILIIKLVFLG